MSGFGGFGGFGSNNQQQQQSTGFGSGGGFGSSGTGTGFGASNTGFGSTTNNNASGSLFGGSGTTTGGFGSGGFGSNATSSPFGQNKTGFGTTTTSAGGGLFGGGTATSNSTFGGFGGGSSSGFGSTAATGSGGLFGQSKPAFGSTTTGSTGGGIFGGGSSGFGSAASTSTPAFGAGASTTFGSSLAQNTGTLNPPFSEHVEKDPAAANTNNRYQTISTMTPYQGYSLEELRLADYSQGRKQGNANGQAGAFGASSGFGGFSSGTTGTSGFGSGGTSSGGLFGGSGTATSSPFGQQQQSTTTGFGTGASGGGLFGAKPAAGGLFGSTTTTTSGQTGGGLFGTSGSSFGTGATTGFGSNPSGFGAGTGTGTTGGLFGSTPAKPAFGGFGSGTSTGFGSTSTSTGGTGLFGGGAAATPSTGFGAQQQSSSTPFSFAQQGQQTQQQGQTGSSLFGGFGGQTQQKPGGLFGNTSTTSTGTGLFGQTAQQQPATGGGLFGSGTQQQQGGGLFGNKPAGGGLFGSTATGSTGGGLFGNPQPQAQTGGLFGQGAQQQQSGGLFGNKPATTGLGSSLFNQPAQQQQSGTSLFGSTQQQQSTLGGSLFGNSQSQQQQQPQALHASISDNPYGNDQLFANLATPSQSVGPLATPLSSTSKSKKQALLPHYRMQPAASNRLLTPQRRPQAYGFSYSTYGTPGSAISSPISLGNSLLGSGLNRSLNKSLSTSNLRHSFNAQDSILVPGAFSTTSRSGASSLKKLNINKNMNVRRPLFGNDSPDYAASSGVRKSVSFEDGINGRADSDTATFSPGNGQLVRTESPEAEPDLPAPRTTGRVPMADLQQVNGASRGKELAIVPEDGPTSTSTMPPPRVLNPYSQKDQEPGAYWMRPTAQEIDRMTKAQKENVVDFTVGRVGCGSVTFSKVDLNTIPINDILGKIVVFVIRSCTVYGDAAGTTKPLPGIGLNVPSVIELENSWPRVNEGRTLVLEKKGPRYEKHIRRLKRLPDTEFLSYDSMSGVWRFRVQHFTTYGLDYDDDEDDSMLDTSVLSAAPGTPTPSKHSKHLSHTSPPFHSDSSLPSPPESSPDDTFDFKKGRRKNLPGQFDEEDVFDEDMSDGQDELNGTNQSFLGERSVGSLGEDGDEAMSQLSESGSEEEQEMAGSFPAPVKTTEQQLANLEGARELPLPKSTLGPVEPFDTPLKSGRFVFNDWTEQLQRTASPRKQDRQALRANQSAAYQQLDEDRDPTPKVSSKDKPFTNPLDIMNSLLGKSQHGRDSTRGKFGASAKGFQNPDPKRARTNGDIDAQNNAFHNTTKPNWGPSGAFVYTTKPVTPRHGDGVVVNFGSTVVGERADVRFAKLNAPDILSGTITEQQTFTGLTIEDGVPRATTSDDFFFAQFAEEVPVGTLAGLQEKRAWELATILFDRIDIPSGLTGDKSEKYELRDRKEQLSSFWKKLVHADATSAASNATTLEEKALHFLSGGMIEEACFALLEGQNFHLATLIPQIGGDTTFREFIANQLADWRKLNVLSEFSDEVRALYEILAGNTSVCKGSSGPGMENWFSEFNISNRFSLDWRRSFGLRLWYGITPTDGLKEAVEQLAKDLSTGAEIVDPVPWFVEKKVDMGWTDPSPNSREDILWTLLKLHADQLGEDLEIALAPENVSGNPMNTRLSFQLVNLFRALELGGVSETSATADALASTYAAGLATSISTEPHVIHTTIWVLMHISDPKIREQFIRALLDQHAPLLEPPSSQLHKDLIELRVPSRWMHLSRALYAHAVTHDSVAEAQSLIEAGEWKQAHELVCKVIGPAAVIEQDSDQLRELLGSLVEQKEGNRLEWNKGAGMYYDYVEMKDLERQRGQRWKELVVRLSKALEGVMGAGLQGRDLTERAALQMMGADVAKIAASGDVLDYGTALRLPLTEDAYLRHSRTLASDYFKAVLGGR